MTAANKFAKRLLEALLCGLTATLTVWLLGRLDVVSGESVDQYKVNGTVAFVVVFFLAGLLDDWHRKRATAPPEAIEFANKRSENFEREKFQ